MSNITRKEFLKLTGAAAGAGLMTTTGLGNIARAQSSELLHRKIHATGEMVPAIGLGTAQTFGDLSQDFMARRNTIETLFKEGGTVIDTAPTYSDAEKVVGRALDVACRALDGRALEEARRALTKISQGRAGFCAKIHKDWLAFSNNSEGSSRAFL